MAESGIFVYVSNALSREISVLRLDPEEGTLAAIQTLAVTGRVQPIAVSPDRRFLYAALRSQPYSLASFAIDQLSGKLTHLISVRSADNMAYISTDRTGQVLFGSSTMAGDFTEPQDRSLISINRIDPNGFIQPCHQVVRTGPKMHAILPDPSNRYVFATSCNGDYIVRQIFDSTTGTFSPNALTPVRVKPKSGPRHFVFHPNNRTLYLVNETDATIYTFRYDVVTGALTELQIVSALPPDFELDKEHPNAHAADIHLTPDGRFLYASVRISHTLSAFKVDLGSGMLTSVGHFPTERVPQGFNIDPYGRHLLAVGMSSHSMTSYRINSETGELIALDQCPVGQGPNWVKIVRLT